MPVDSDLFTLREAAALAGVAEDRVRRELEHDVIEPTEVETVGSARRLFFCESSVLYFALLRALAGEVDFAPSLRRRAFRLLGHACGRRQIHADTHSRNALIKWLVREWNEHVNRVLTVDWGVLFDTVTPRIALYRAGQVRLHSDASILGGEPVFTGTRLAVRHIGGMRLKGEPTAAIIEDYPYLSLQDVEFAALYTEAHPAIGRPKTVGMRDRL